MQRKIALRNKKGDNKLSDVFFTHSFFKSTNQNLNSQIKQYLKILLLVLLFVFSLVTLFTLDQIFFNSPENVNAVLRNTTFKIKENNFVAIAKSSILVWGVIISLITNFANINLPELKLKKYWPWMIGYFIFTFGNGVLYFFLKLEDKMMLFYLSFIVIGFVLYNFVYILLQDRQESKISPLAKNKMLVFTITYAIKFISYLILYSLFWFFITGGTNDLLFRQNTIIKWLTKFLSNLNTFGNIVLLFLIVSGSILLWLFSNLNYLLYLRETVKNPSKYEAIFYFGLIIGISIFIWFSKIAFGEFVNFDSVWKTNKTWLNIYLLIGFNAILLSIFGFFTFKKNTLKFGPLIHNLIYTAFNLLIWSITITLTIFNKNNDENFKMYWISGISTIILFALHFIKSLIYLRGFNGIIVGLAALITGIAFATMGYNNHLAVNNNILNVNNGTLTLNQISYLLIFLVALIQLIIFLVPYLLITFNMQFKWMHKIKLKKVHFKKVKSKE